MMLCASALLCAANGPCAAARGGSSGRSVLPAPTGHRQPKASDVPSGERPGGSDRGHRACADAGAESRRREGPSRHRQRLLEVLRQAPPASCGCRRSVSAIALAQYQRGSSRGGAMRRQRRSVGRNAGGMARRAALVDRIRAVAPRRRTGCRRSPPRTSWSSGFRNSPRACIPTSIPRRARAMCSPSRAAPSRPSTRIGSSSACSAPSCPRSRTASRASRIAPMAARAWRSRSSSKPACAGAMARRSPRRTSPSASRSAPIRARAMRSPISGRASTASTSSTSSPPSRISRRSGPISPNGARSCPSISRRSLTRRRKGRATTAGCRSIIALRRRPASITALIAWLNTCRARISCSSPIPYWSGEQALFQEDRPAGHREHRGAAIESARRRYRHGAGRRRRPHHRSGARAPAPLSGPLHLLFKPSLTYEHLDVSGTNPLLADLRVRQALLYAADRKTMTEKLFNGMQPVADSFVVPLNATYSPDVPRYPL